MFGAIAAVHRTFLYAFCLGRENPLHLQECFSLEQEFQLQQIHFHQNIVVLFVPACALRSNFFEVLVFLNPDTYTLI